MARGPTAQVGSWIALPGAVDLFPRQHLPPIRPAPLYTPDLGPAFPSAGIPDCGLVCHHLLGPPTISLAHPFPHRDVRGRRVRQEMLCRRNSGVLRPTRQRTLRKNYTHLGILPCPRMPKICHWPKRTCAILWRKGPEVRLYATLRSAKGCLGHRIWCPTSLNTPWYMACNSSRFQPRIMILRQAHSPECATN